MNANSSHLTEALEALREKAKNAQDRQQFFLLAELVSRFTLPTPLSKVAHLQKQLLGKPADAAGCLYLYYHAWTALERVQVSVGRQLKALDAETLLDVDSATTAVSTAVKRGVSTLTACDLLFSLWLELVALSSCGELFAHGDELGYLQGNADAGNLTFTSNQAFVNTYTMRLLNPLEAMQKKNKNPHLTALVTQLTSVVQLVDGFDATGVVCKKLRTATVACTPRATVRLNRPFTLPFGVLCRARGKLRNECFLGPLDRCASVQNQTVCPQDVLLLYNINVGFHEDHIVLPPKVAFALALDCAGNRDGAVCAKRDVHILNLKAVKKKEQGNN